jgi:hypothetical protein
METKRAIMKTFLIKILAIISKKREHYKNRLQLRKGKTIHLINASLIEVRKDNSGTCYIFQNKNHIYFIQNNKLQSYINKNEKKNTEMVAKI